MPVKLTPNGTYGIQMPRPPRPLMPLMRALMRLGSAGMRRRGMKVLTLVTTGAKSGRVHEVELGWFPEPGSSGDADHAPGRWLIVGSAGGSSKHPAWVYNLAGHPDQTWIRLEGRTIKVRPDSLEGDERAAAFARISAELPNYGTYQTRTDRQIPIIRLTEEPG